MRAKIPRKTNFIILAFSIGVEMYTEHRYFQTLYLYQKITLTKAAQRSGCIYLPVGNKTHGHVEIKKIYDVHIIELR